MDFPAVQNQINDLPRTFKRDGAPYTNYVDAVTAGLFLFTQGVDGMMDQTDFAKAAYGWLDVWGLVLGIPRRMNEPDPTYRARIQNVILAPHGSPVAILSWLTLIEGIQAELLEALPALGYTITLPPNLTPDQITAILTNLARVRPAGVPFNVLVFATGTFLDTVNYLDAARVTGQYLGGSTTAYTLSIPAGTPNTVAGLPDLLLTDPTINPNLPA